MVHPLRSIFLDLNSYFASVEQQEHPELRGRPVAVVPMEVDTSFVLAASYEAKAFGVKTGTQIGQARADCPGLVLVKATHGLYLRYHERVLEAVETVLPIHKVASVDEMSFELLGKEREPEEAKKLALQLKRAIHDHVGEALKCSIGIAPNPFLAKVGTELQKPDGLVVLEQEDIQPRLETLPLMALPGINKRMLARLNAAGIFSVANLYANSATDLKRAFGSVNGERWWYLLRGYDLESPATRRRSLGHSHVLPPDMRNEAGAREVMLRLCHKALARLRTNHLKAQNLTLLVKGYEKSWEAHVSFPATSSTPEVTAMVRGLWERSDFEKPRLVSITFGELLDEQHATASLFDDSMSNDKMSQALDALNQRFGKHSVYLASMEGALGTASEKIAFQKTWLFDEGAPKGDTFRGLKSKEE